MAATARKFEMEPQMHERTVLDAKVDHIQSDVAGLKSDVKRIDAKVDAVGASLTEHRIETERSFAKVRDEMAKQRDELKASIAALRNDMTEAIGALRVEMKDSLAALRRDRSAQIGWLIGTAITAVGAAFTAAKFFSTH